MMNHIWKINRKIRIERTDFGNVTIKFLNQSHIFHQIIMTFWLMIIVDLLDQNSVPIQNRLYLLEIIIKSRPYLGVSSFEAAVFVIILIIASFFNVTVVVEIGGVSVTGVGGGCERVSFS